MPDFGLVKVLICPDSFTGTLSAAEAAAAIAEGWASVAPGDELVLRPLSDGGPGFLDAIAAGRGGVRHSSSVTGPLGSPVTAEYLMTDDGTAWIESASAAGLHLVPGDRRDPTRTTSRGVGELMAAALADGATRIVVGVGGTGTCDGGAGLLEALGALSQPPGELSRGGVALAGLALLDLAPAVAARRTGSPSRWPPTSTCRCSVPAGPPGDSARRRAPPPSRSSSSRRRWPTGRPCWADPPMGGRPPSPSAPVPAAASGRRSSDSVPIGSPASAPCSRPPTSPGSSRSVDLVVTGEGSFDWQSLRGKVVAGVAGAALGRAVPVVVLAGRVEVSRREWITAGVAAAFPAAAEPGESHHEGVARAAARAARTWSRG